MVNVLMQSRACAVVSRKIGMLGQTLISFVVAIVLYLALIKYVFPRLTIVTPDPSYIHYIEEATLIVIVLAIVISLRKGFSSYLGKSRTSFRSALKIVLDTVLYFAALLIILSILGISLTGAVLGGAFAGIVIGMALQSVASQLVSGYLAMSSGAILPGDMVSLHAGMFGGDLIGRVEKVGTILTTILDINSVTVVIPNSVLLSSTVVRRIKRSKIQSLTQSATVNADIPADRVIQEVRGCLVDKLKIEGSDLLEILYVQRNGGTNLFNANLRSEKERSIADFIHLTNSCFDSAYWSLKNK